MPVRTLPEPEPSEGPAGPAGPPGKLPGAGEEGQALTRTIPENGKWSNAISGGTAELANLLLLSNTSAKPNKVFLGNTCVVDEKITEHGETQARLGLFGGIENPKAYIEVEPGTGGKPVTVATSPGTNAQAGIKVVGPKGGDTSIATTGIGGTGSSINLKGGEGGEAPSAVTSSTGGNGGTVAFITGAGAPGKENAETSKGGNGALFQFQTGGGGKGIGTVSGTGGAAGELKLAAGNGGEGSTTGGSGSTIDIKGGKGGKGGTAGGKGTQILMTAGEGGAGGGAGGPIIVTAGNSTGTAAAGKLEFIAGKGAEANKGGEVIVKTENLIAFSVTTAQAVLFTKGIGLFGHAAPAVQPAEIKPEAITVMALMEKLNILHKEFGITA